MSDVLRLRRRQVELELELKRLDREITRAEESRFIRVVFPGNTKSYCYEVPSGITPKVGDYFMVYSPHTGKNEIVKVRYLGRGDWRFGTKVAHPIVWAPAAGHCDYAVDDLFPGTDR